MGLMTDHRRRMYGSEPEIYWNRLPVSQTEHITQVFGVSFPKGASQCKPPFTNCPGYLRTWNGLRNHFNLQQWGDSIRILEEHPTPLTKCKRCGSQVPTWILRNQHYESYKYRIKEELRSRRKNLQHCFKASRISISVNSEPLDLVADFTYLGRTVIYNNSGWEALCQNLRKARRQWVMVRKVV